MRLLQQIIILTSLGALLAANPVRPERVDTDANVSTFAKSTRSDCRQPYAAHAAALFHIQSRPFQNRLERFVGQDSQLRFVFSGSTRLEGSRYVRFQPFVGDVTISGATLVVTVEDNCKMKSVFVEPERLVAATLLGRQLAKSTPPSFAARPVLSDGPLPMLWTLRDAKLAPTLSIDVSGAAAVLVNKWESSDGRFIVFDEQRQVTSSSGWTDMHGVTAASLTTMIAGSSPEASQVAHPWMITRPAKSEMGSSAYVTGNGMAYEVDPLYGEPVMQPIMRLHDDGNRLDGKYVRTISHALDLDGLPTASSDGSKMFIYEPTPETKRRCAYDPEQCSLFDNVNVYVHIDRFAHEFWSSKLEIDVDWQVLALTHVTNEGSVARGDTIVFGWGGLFLLNNAMEDEIIYHEYAHVALENLGLAADIFSSTQKRAVGEGYADYFALSYTGQPEFANWATRCPPRFECTGPEDAKEIRTLQTDASEWNWQFGKPSVRLKYGVCTRKHIEDTKCKTSWNTYTSTYIWGMIWGSTLWDIRTAYGADVADKLAAAGVTLAGGIINSFTTAAGSILHADRLLFDGQHHSGLREIFHNRGISPFLSLGVGIDETGEQDRPSNFDAVFFPNPFDHSLNVEVTSVAQTKAVATLFDLNGRALFSQDLGYLAAGKTQLTIDVPDLPNGFYLVSVKTNDATVSKMISRSATN